MKILHIFNELKPSGAEVRFKVGAVFFKEYKIENHILSTGEISGSYTSALSKAGYLIHHIPFRKSYSFFKKLFDLVRKNKYDVVHIHTERANFWYALTVRIAGISSVIRTICNIFKHRRVMRIIQNNILLWLKVKLVSISSSVQKNELEFYKTKTILILNWYNNIDIKPPNFKEREASRIKLGIKKEEFVIVTVGNCSRVKNHMTLIKALTMLKNKMSFIYIHIGLEEEGNPERKLVVEAGLAEQVHFYGFIENILPYLWAADTYVMPSTYEGFGVAAAEALGTGVPAILSDIPGFYDFKKVINKGLWWCDPKEPASIADALIEIWNIPLKERYELGLKLSKEVSKNYGVERGITSYIKLYNECVNK